MKINIFGSTGIIGSKTLGIINIYFPDIKINLLCANSNVKKFINQIKTYSPKYVYLNDITKIKFLKKNISRKIKILNFNELNTYLTSSKSDLTLLAISMNIYSCSPANILVGGGATGMVVAEGDRSFGSVVDDATIKINIAAKFINSQDNLFIDVSTSVLEGRVLLTGLVDNQEIRIDAVRKVWEIEGVNEVINEIQIGERADLKEYAQDLWITTQVRGLAAKTIGLRTGAAKRKPKAVPMGAPLASNLLATGTLPHSQAGNANPIIAPVIGASRGFLGSRWIHAV